MQNPASAEERTRSAEAWLGDNRARRPVMLATLLTFGIGALVFFLSAAIVWIVPVYAVMQRCLALEAKFLCRLHL